MEQLTFNVYATVLAVFTVLVSLVAIAVSIAQAAITQDIAKQSNKLSKKALEIAFFNHRVDVEPEISATAHLTFSINFMTVKVACFLTNKSRGEALIQGIELHSGSIEFNAELKIPLPVELRFNNSKRFEIKFNPISELQYIEAATEIKAFSTSSDVTKQKLEQVVLNQLRQCFMTVYYLDSIGTSFITDLYLKENPLRFEGTPRYFAQANNPLEDV